MKNIDTTGIPFCNYKTEEEDWIQLLLDESPDCFDWSLAKQTVSAINIMIDGEYVGSTEIPQRRDELATTLYNSIRHIRHDINHYTKVRHKMVSMKMSANDEEPIFTLYFSSEAPIVVFKNPAVQEITFDILVDYDEEI